MKPLAVDLCAGLGGWSEGLIAEGWDVIGFDIERHQYGNARYPGQLVLQDILTLDGKNFRGHVSLIVASPPCQKYSYMAMPWRRSKDLARWYRDPQHPQRITELNALFNACFRIAGEADCPIVIENVRGAQPWVGRAKATFGSFYLWGDVPALMPMIKRAVKSARPNRHGVMAWTTGHLEGYWESNQRDDTENDGGSWFNVAHNMTSGHSQNPDGRKVPTDRVCDCGHRESEHEAYSFLDRDCPCSLCSCINPVWLPDNGRRTDVGKGARFTSRDCGEERKNGGDWFAAGADCSLQRRASSKSSARKAASAHIAKIPFVLARHIARVYHPETL